MLKLTVRFGDREEFAKVFSPQQLPIRIGRASDCEVHIDNAMVSRLHAIVGMLGNKFVIVDQDSSNGFGLNDEKDVRIAILNDGDVVHLGKFAVEASITVVKKLKDTERRFKALAGEGGDLEATISMDKLASRPGGAGEAAHKLQITKPTNRLCPLTAWHTWIGSAESNDIVVRGFGIAPKHLLIYWDGDAYHAADLSGKKKVKVNGEGIDDVVLAKNDTIRIGALEMEYRQA